jgi:gluconate 2-dehydrogenase alpha chain
MEAYPIAISRVVPPGQPRWGAAYKAYLAANGNSIANGINQLDTLPYEQHFLDLDPDNVDEDRRPLLRITNTLQEQERLRALFVTQKAVDLYKAAGASIAWAAAPAAPQASTHALGGTRMGPDPATSVVNPDGVAHEVPNLVIMGGSVLPSHGGSNPTLTIQAVAWRTAQQLIKNWDSIAKEPRHPSTKKTAQAGAAAGADSMSMPAHK